jgi:hypothetical protein
MPIPIPTTNNPITVADIMITFVLSTKERLTVKFFSLVSPLLLFQRQWYVPNSFAFPSRSKTDAVLLS